MKILVNPSRSIVLTALTLLIVLVCSGCGEPDYFSVENSATMTVGQAIQNGQLAPGEYAVQVRLDYKKTDKTLSFAIMPSRIAGDGYVHTIPSEIAETIHLGGKATLKELSEADRTTPVWVWKSYVSIPVTKLGDVHTIAGTVTETTRFRRINMYDALVSPQKCVKRLADGTMKDMPTSYRTTKFAGTLDLLRAEGGAPVGKIVLNGDQIVKSSYYCPKGGELVRNQDI
jgi:hypothetical protein